MKKKPSPSRSASSPTDASARRSASVRVVVLIVRIMRMPVVVPVLRSTMMMMVAISGAVTTAGCVTNGGYTSEHFAKINGGRLDGDTSRWIPAQSSLGPSLSSTMRLESTEAEAGSDVM